MLVYCENRVKQAFRHKFILKFQLPIYLDYRVCNRPRLRSELTDWIGIPKGFQNHFFSPIGILKEYLGRILGADVSGHSILS